jgi:methionine-rich copper-binding protein CopC
MGTVQTVHTIGRPARAAGARLALVALLVAAALGTSSPTAALAAPPEHARYVGSTPANGSIVAAAPARVVARFSEAVRPQGSSMTVIAPDGSRADVGNSAVDTTDPNRTTLTVTLRTGLGNGTYVVNYTTVSAEDGDTETSRFTFSIGAPSLNAALPRTGGGPLAGGLGAALVIGGRLLRRRV